MRDVLAEICAEKRAHIARAKAVRSEATLLAGIGEAPPVRPFAAALERHLTEGRYGLIAEVKKASPSAGLIRRDFDPRTLATAYSAGGASCLSVLTDGPYFRGSDDDLTAAREAVRLPVLRKDFILDPYQVLESRSIGADCILLIMAALSDTEAAELASAAAEFGLDVLAEIHDGAELDRALRLPVRLIGINNRNLKTLETDLHTAETLTPEVPSDRIVVAESDAVCFACNAINVDRTIILNNISADLRHQLETHGFNIIEVTLTEFLKAGGAAKCLVMKLSRPEREAATLAS